MWHLITINLTLSALALLVLGAYRPADAAAWLIAAQFGGYALVMWNRSSSHYRRGIVADAG